ncbi:MAG: sporulation transcriptional regulator SpoIIID [Christensenellales bacterium]
MQKDAMLNVARYIAMTGCTVREASRIFGVSKSTVHNDMTKKLVYVDASLYGQVKKVLDFNMSVRHLRGGESTKKLYLKKHSAQSQS